MEREFKVGDRVVWHEGQSYEDFGVITHFDEDVAYVDWECDGRNLPVSLRYIKHAEPEVNFEEALLAFTQDITDITLKTETIKHDIKLIKQWYAESKKADPELAAAKALCEANGFRVIK